jgi:D-alanyl-D-alanine carboxypeptidase (penicillin-binding protein 5/6)
MGALPIWLVMAASALFLCGFGPPQMVDREIAPTTRVSVGELRSWAERSAQPQLSAESYLLYDLGSDRVLYSRNSAAARPPASLTKLMTALLVLERGNLDAVMSVEAGDMLEGATMGLSVGDQVSVTDLLWGLLLPSGNDAASVLARHVSGSVAEFVALMNRRAQELGLQQTHFVNPHGLDAEGHLSSANDLLHLTRELWSYPLFRSMVGTARIQWNGRELFTTNEWLTGFEGVTGVKTGTTDLAGECLVASVEQDGRTIFLVIMGSDNRYQDASTLYESFRSAYTWDAADGRALSVFNRIRDEQGELWFVQPAGAAPAVLQVQAGVPQLRSFRHMQLPASETLSPGAQVGVLEWWAGSEPVGTQSLVVR